MAKEEMDEYLRNKWMPQPTGKLLFGVCILHVNHFISIVMLMFAYVHTQEGTSACSDVSTDVTEEMKVYELSHADLEILISNPCQTRWTLNAQPSPQFYADLHQVLKKRSVPMNEIHVGMIYRKIDPELRKSTTTNKEAYTLVQSRVEESSICSNANPNPGDDEQDLDNIEDQGSPSRYKVKNVKHRERRAKS